MHGARHLVAVLMRLDGRARVYANMRMGIDQPRNHDLAIKVMDPGTRGHRHVSALADGDELAVLNDEIGVADLTAADGQNGRSAIHLDRWFGRVD